MDQICALALYGFGTELLGIRLSAHHIAALRHYEIAAIYSTAFATCLQHHLLLVVIRSVTQRHDTPPLQTSQQILRVRILVSISPPISFPQIVAWRATIPRLLPSPSPSTLDISALLYRLFLSPSSFSRRPPNPIGTFLTNTKPMVTHFARPRLRSTSYEIGIQGKLKTQSSTSL
jgi:hypothetical protein